MPAPQTIRSALGHSDVIEFTFFNHLGESADAFLDSCVLGHTSTFEKIELFGSPEAFVDLVYAALQVFGTEGDTSVTIEVMDMKPRTSHLVPFCPVRHLPINAFGCQLWMPSAIGTESDNYLHGEKCLVGI